MDRSGTGVPEPPSLVHADLRRGLPLLSGEGQYPAMVHDEPEPEQILIEGAGTARIGGSKVGNDASDSH